MGTPPIVLVPGSWLAGGGVGPGYGVTDGMAEQIAGMVYVDAGAAAGALDSGLSAAEVPLPSWEELQEDGSRPRRAHYRAARDVPAAGSSRAGCRTARGARADQRRAPRRAEHGRVHVVHVRADQGRSRGELSVDRRPG